MHCEVIVKVVHNTLVAEQGVSWIEVQSFVLGALRLLETIKEDLERKVLQAMRRNDVAIASDRREYMWKLIGERDKWKGLALFLADCHAATAEHEGRLKSTSNSNKERYRSICKIAEAWIEDRGDKPTVRSVESVLERLKGASKEE